METEMSWSSFTGATNMLTLYIGLAVAVLLLVALILVFTRMGRLRRECRETIARKFNSADIVCHDNLVHYLGNDTITRKQTRGKGVLVLAQDELFFFQLHPRLELSIPLKRIKRVVTPTKFLDISSPTPLLSVHFQEENGRVSGVAWKIRDLTSFTESLKEQRKKVQPRKRK